MKKITVLVLTFLVCSVSSVWAGDGKECPIPTIKTSAELATIKALAGKWTGTAKHSNGTTEPTVVEYHLTSGGSAVEEKITPGTPHEMVTMYHDLGGKLAMTHYCMLGNQPQMVLSGNRSQGFQVRNVPK